jgi:hypothetical protein
MSTPARRRARRAPDGWRLPLWKVTITEHSVSRYYIPADTVKVPASTPKIARSVAVRWAHRDAGVPPLRSLLAVSMEHAHADPARSATVRSRAAI